MRINHKNANRELSAPTTKQRSLLLELLRSSTDHLDAKGLYLKALERDSNISMATVYRNLKLFKELGIIDERRLDELHYYYEIRGDKEHYHMICSACGSVVEFHSPHVKALIDEVRKSTNFDVKKAVLYLEGHCAKCKDRKA